MGGRSSDTAGIELKQAAKKDVLAKMEEVFGLHRGGGISGTTADMIHFINRFSKAVAGFDPIYYLMPVATLVYNYHHALIEVAGTLAINGIID